MRVRRSQYDTASLARGGDNIKPGFSQIQKSNIPSWFSKNRPKAQKLLDAPQPPAKAGGN
jgi:hypothetical protein